MSNNYFENCCHKTFNGQGVLGDAHGSGVVADGTTGIIQTAIYQARITGNVVTEPQIGRAAAIYGIRIMNDAFANGDKLYIQNNVSQGAAVHVQNDGTATILDMDTRSSGGVFSSAEKTAIQDSVTALEGYHPVTPTVYENLSTNANVQILATDRFVLIKHDQVEGITVTMPSDAVNGQIITVKNYHVGNASQGGNYIITVLPAPNQIVPHVIDFKYSSLELKASTVASGLLSDLNETVRLMWYALDASWICSNDSF